MHMLVHISVQHQGYGQWVAQPTYLHIYTFINKKACAKQVSVSKSFRLQATCTAAELYRLRQQARPSKTVQACTPAAHLHPHGHQLFLLRTYSIERLSF